MTKQKNKKQFKYGQNSKIIQKSCPSRENSSLRIKTINYIQTMHIRAWRPVISSTDTKQQNNYGYS